MDLVAARVSLNPREQALDGMLPHLKERLRDGCDGRFGGKR